MTSADITARRRILTGAAIAIGAATAAVGTAGPASADDSDPTPGVFTGLSVAPSEGNLPYDNAPTLEFDLTGASIKTSFNTNMATGKGTCDALTVTGMAPRSAVVVNQVYDPLHPEPAWPAPPNPVAGYGIKVSSSYSTAVLAAVVQKHALVDAAIVTNAGSGRALAATSSGASPTISAVNNGTGPAATFTGGLSAAQIRLNPGHLKTHPTAGTVGDFYLDAGARLWFCKGATWKQIA